MACFDVAVGPLSAGGLGGAAATTTRLHRRHRSRGAQRGGEGKSGVGAPPFQSAPPIVLCVCVVGAWRAAPPLLLVWGTRARLKQASANKHKQLGPSPSVRQWQRQEGGEEGKGENNNNNINEAAVTVVLVPLHLLPPLPPRRPSPTPRGWRRGARIPSLTSERIC
jgi:hypothetical protein